MAPGSDLPGAAAESGAPARFDAVLLVSFGGPEGPEEVWPFLRSVTKGRGVPDERLAEVAGHYQLFGGRSPINDQNRALLELLRPELAPRALYWGNRNSPPFLADTVAQMATDGVRNAAVFVTAAYASYSSCRQYREDLAGAITAATAAAPEGPDPAGIRFHKLRHYYNHPGFIEAQVDRVREALIEAAAAADQPPADDKVPRLVFTAHSIPVAAADSSGPPGGRGAYPRQLAETARLVAEGVGAAGAAGQDEGWDLVYQSGSGPPSVPWLGPDVVEHLEHLAEGGVHDVVVVPSGFVSDHLEVAFDLDVEAREAAQQLGIRLTRASTVGTHPAFVQMVHELVDEREHVEHAGPRFDGVRPVAGGTAPSHDVCPLDCCPGRVRKPAAAGTELDAHAPIGDGEPSVRR